MSSEKRIVRTAVLGSTRGSSLVPLLNAWKASRLGVDFALVVSNRSQAGILEKGRDAGIESVAIPAKGRDRVSYDAEISDLLKSRGVELVLLLGYMRILSDAFVKDWQGRILNVHPSLLPRHGGLMDLEVHASVLSSGDRESGCTIHLVDETVDGGPIVIQKRCPVLADDTPESLKAQVQVLEGAAFLEVLCDPVQFLPALLSSMVL